MLLIAHPAWGLLGSDSSLATARAPTFAEGRGVRTMWVGRRVSFAGVIGSGDPHGVRLPGPLGGLAVGSEREAEPSLLGRAAEERQRDRAAGTDWRANADPQPAVGALDRAVAVEPQVGVLVPVAGREQGEPVYPFAADVRDAQHERDRVADRHPRVGGAGVDAQRGLTRRKGRGRSERGGGGRRGGRGGGGRGQERCRHGRRAGGDRGARGGHHGGGRRRAYGRSEPWGGRGAGRRGRDLGGGGNRHRRGRRRGPRGGGRGPSDRRAVPDDGWRVRAGGPDKAGRDE